MSLTHWRCPCWGSDYRGMAGPLLPIEQACPHCGTAPPAPPAALVEGSGAGLATGLRRSGHTGRGLRKISDATYATIRDAFERATTSRERDRLAQSIGCSTTAVHLHARKMGWTVPRLLKGLHWREKYAQEPLTRKAGT